MSGWMIEELWRWPEGKRAARREGTQGFGLGLGKPSQCPSWRLIPELEGKKGWEGLAKGCCHEAHLQMYTCNTLRPTDSELHRMRMALVLIVHRAQHGPEVPCSLVVWGLHTCTSRTWEAMAVVILSSPSGWDRKARKWLKPWGKIPRNN